MFQCFGYPDRSSTVVPFPSPTPTSSEALSTLMNINTPRVYIHIEGMGTNDPSLCRSYTSSNKDVSIFEYISYGSKSIFLDLASAIENIRRVAHEIPPSNKMLLGRKRLHELENRLVYYLTKTKDINIVVVGISHGSIIVHSAILKLKMHLDSTIQDNLNKRVTIVTLGSPRYLPVKLLSSGKIYNFYNIEDPLVFKLSSLPYVKVPSLDSINIDKDINPAIEKSTNAPENYNKDELPKYYYNKNKGIVLVRNIEAFVDVYYPEFNYGKKPEDTFKEYSDIAKYHCCPFNFIPLMDVSIVAMLMSYFRDKDEDKALKAKGSYITDCNNPPLPLPKPLPEGGAKSTKTHILYRPNKRQYKVKDSHGKYITIQKQKAYLKDIRGKFIYI